MKTCRHFLRAALLLWLSALFFHLLPTTAQAALPVQKPPTLTKISANQYRLTWWGEPGRVYFPQTTTDLKNWVYSDVVEYGRGADISWDVSTTGSRFFVRLKMSADAVPEGGEGDIDGDGLKNLDEVKFFKSDPFVSDDKDGDSYIDADETAQGTSPTDATSKPFDPANPPVVNRYVAPLSWWVENKFNDTVERATVQGLTGQISTWNTQAATLADGSYDMPYTSIQAAVNAATAGDVIQIAPGIYRESVDLSTKDVRLIGQKGSREETVIDLYTPNDPATTADESAVRAYGLKLGASNTAVTVVSGLTIRNSGAKLTTPVTGGTAVICGSGTSARLHNLLIQNPKCGIAVDASSPLVLNTVIDGCTGTGATDAALRVTGTSAVKASNCTVTDSATSGGQIQVSGSTASLTLVSSIVTSSGTSNRTGGQIQLTSSGTATVTWSSIRAGYTGEGNITSQNPADTTAPYFDTDSVSGGQRRLLRASEAVDRGNPVGIPGFSYLTRLDSDGEFRRRAYGLELQTGRQGSADMGADEYVSRLKFPTIARTERGQTKVYSSVDEASDVAFIGQKSGGDARIAIINDETIEDNSSVQHNDVTFFDVSASTGELVSTSYSTAARALNRNGSFGGNEVKDPEAIAYDSKNGKLYITTSMTKVNHYRDCEPQTYDPLIDPPSNDYDPRRCVMVTVPLDTMTLNPTGSNIYTDANDGSWTTGSQSDRADMDAFANGASTTSPVGYDSTKGLIATLKAQLEANTALGASVKNNGVLIAISTSPKFGEPVNGTSYAPGTALPYKQTTGLGGPSAGAGWVLSNSADAAPAVTVANGSPATTKTLTWGAAALRGQSFKVTVNNRSYTGTVQTSHDAMLQSLAALLAADTDIASAVVTVVGNNQTGSDDRVITLTPKTDPAPNPPPPPAPVPPPVARTLTASVSGFAGFRFPYWTLDTLPVAGVSVTGYQTAVAGSSTALSANTTYYFKVWAYDSSLNYGRGLEAQATTSAFRPILVNEIYGAGEGTNSVSPDSVEFFNPSGIAVKLTGLSLTTQNFAGSLPDYSGTDITLPARSLYRIQKGNSTSFNPTGRSSINAAIGNGSDFAILTDGTSERDNYLFVRNQPKVGEVAGPADEGRVWDGGPSGRKFDFSKTRFENHGAYFRDGAATHPKSFGNATTSTGASNHTQTQGAAKFLQATHNHTTQKEIFLHYANLGEELAVWRYSPKQQDFHPINVEGLAVRNQSEIVVGLRSPLTNRTTGKAYAFVFSNVGDAMLPAPANTLPPQAVWTGAAGGLQGTPKQLDLGGQGIRSIQWCKDIKNAAGGDGAYLIIGGAANGGPLKNETTRQKFSLYRWDSIDSTPVRVVADLSPYATRPEGINIITLNGVKRAIFVEDRFKAEGYDTQNGVHWPVTALNLQ